MNPKPDTTPDIIVALVDDLQPVAPVAPVAQRWLLWLGVVAAVFTLALAVVGLRADMAARLVNADFQIQIVLLGVAALAAAAVSLWLAVPRLVLSKRAWVLLALALFGFVTVVASYGLRADVGIWNVYAHRACLLDVLALSAVPMLALLWLLHRGATTYKTLAALAAGGAAGVAAMLASLFVCGNDSAVHLLQGHALPVLLVAVFTTIVGRILLRW